MSKPFRSVGGIEITVSESTDTNHSHQLEHETAIELVNIDNNDIKEDTIKKSDSLSTSNKTTDNELNELMKISTNELIHKIEENETDETSAETIKSGPESSSRLDVIDEKQQDLVPTANRSPYQAVVFNRAVSDLSDYAAKDHNDDCNVDNKRNKDNMVLQALDVEIQLKLQNKIQTPLMVSGHFWIRICILILTILWYYYL